MPTVTPARLRLLLSIFVLSGFAGLIYQSIWSHYLGLFLGHAAYAQALVLAIFMGGMAAGAGLVSRAGERWRNLIRGYALVEAVIGLLGLVFHGIFVSVLGLSYETLMPALGQPWLIGAYKWSLAAFLILPQTILLGMTFPLMSGGIIRRFPGRDGNILGNLYFTNSIGAAIGVLVAAFLLLPRVGLPGAMITAGILNLLVAGLAWWLGAGHELPISKSPTAKPSRLPAHKQRLLKIVLLATFLSGAASFVYEIVWIRMLSLAVGNTLHAFELMLASFIAGIAFGGLWIRRRADNTQDPLKLVGLLQVLMGMSALASLVLYTNAFAWVGFLMESLSRTDGGYILFNLGTATISIVIMLPAAFFAGTTLPLFTTVLLRDGQGEASIGRVYAWNTLGAIAGVFATIHVLIPLLGLKHALAAAALVDMLIGLVILRMRDTEARATVKSFIPAAAVILSLVLATLIPFDPMRLSSGVYYWGTPYLSANNEIRYYRDGKTASISVISRDDGNHMRIATNGKVDASIQLDKNKAPTKDEPTMVLAAAITLAYNPQVRNAAVIGLGSGLTTHTLLTEPTLSHVDTIEIERAMVAGAREFGTRVERAYTDPRSNIVIDDAKSFFSGHHQRYDIIISEPSNPWISGVGALFSQEFYEFIPHYLNEDGVLLQWLQLYEIDDALIGSVLNALTPAFADYQAYLSNSSDLLILASPSKLPDNPDFERLFHGDMAEELHRVGIQHPEQLRFRQVADARFLRALARLHDIRPNSDYFPILSLYAPRTRFRQDSASGIYDIPILAPHLLEWLNVRRPLPAEVPTGIANHFNADALTEDARAIAQILTDSSRRNIEDESTSIEREALRFHALASSCSDAWSEKYVDTMTRDLLWLTRTTLPFLTAKEQHGVLINPAWADCARFPDELAEMIELLESHAKRDATDMEQRGMAWLAHAGERTEYFNAFDPIVLTGVQLSLIYQDRLDDAITVAEAFDDRISESDNNGHQLTRNLINVWLEVE